MKDRIKEVITHIVEVPLAGEWKISLYSAKIRRHAVVEIRTDSGAIGFGEASPSPAFMGETADTIKTVNDLYLAPAITGLQINNLQSIHDAMDSVIYGNSSAKSAIDIAVHDSLGKKLGMPVYELIGGLTRDNIPVTYVIGMKNMEDVYGEAIKKIEQGYSVLKIKVGIDFDRDVTLVRKIWEAIEDSKKKVKVRLDANQGYTVAEAVNLMHVLESEGEIESIEQPVRKWDVFGLKEIRQKIRTPLMLDETIFGIHDVTNAIRFGIADVINLKICKVGGLFQAHKIAGMAEAAGIKCTVGSNLELGLGIAASLHFVASHPVVSYPSDFICGFFLHEHDIVSEDLLSFIHEGKLSVINRPGLGVSFIQE